MRHVQDSGDAQAPSADDHWKIVQAYIDTDTAWHAKTEEIYRADDSDEERERRLKEERGEHPDIMLAVTAATGDLDAGGERVLDAARFLVEHPRNLSSTDDQDIEFGMAALKSVVGPDWSLVETLRENQDEWQQRYDEINDADIPGEEKRERREELGDVPEDTAAVAAALSIVEIAGHEHGREAAEFLIKPGVGPPAPESALMAAKALENSPDYDNWTNVFSWLDGVRPWDTTGGVYDFIAEMAETATDPVDRATARYFAAAALMDGLGRGSVTPEKRDDLRRRALEHAIVLSVGVEEEAFVRELTVDGESVTKTLAETEADAGSRYPACNGGRNTGGRDRAPLGRQRGEALGLRRQSHPVGFLGDLVRAVHRSPSGTPRVGGGASQGSLRNPCDQR